MDRREELERTIEMLKYSIESNEQQLLMYRESDLEWMYAKKIIDSCRETLSAREKELEALKKS